LLLPAAACCWLLLPTAACGCLLLPAAACCCLLLPAAGLLLPAVACCCLLLPAAACCCCLRAACVLLPAAASYCYCCRRCCCYWLYWFLCCCLLQALPLPAATGCCLLLPAASGCAELINPQRAVKEIGRNSCFPISANNFALRQSRAKRLAEGWQGPLGLPKTKVTCVCRSAPLQGSFLLLAGLARDQDPNLKPANH
jgi:hypothetical protein